MAPRLLTVLVLFAALSITACGGPGFEPAATIVAEATPTVTIQSTTSNVEEIQLIQLDNCDGKADLKRTEQRSQSVEAEVSAEVAAQIGASAQVVYGNVQTAVGMALNSGNERGTAILVGYVDSSAFFIGCHPLDYVAPIGGENFSWNERM